MRGGLKFRGGVLGLMEVSGGSLGHCGGGWGPGRRLQALWGELGLKVGGGPWALWGGLKLCGRGPEFFWGVQGSVWGRGLYGKRPGGM